MITQLADIDSSAAECEKVSARNADNPDMMLTGHEQEAIRVVRAVLARAAEKERSRTRRPLLPQREHAPERKCARTTPQLHGRPRDDMSVAVSADRDC
jgi:hypothetical protein